MEIKVSHHEAFDSEQFKTFLSSFDKSIMHSCGLIYFFFPVSKGAVGPTCCLVWFHTRGVGPDPSMLDPKVQFVGLV